MLRTRLLLAACIIMPLLGLMWADVRWSGGHPGIFLFPVALAIWLLAGGELRQMMSEGGMALPALSFFASLALVCLAPGLYVYWELFGAQYPANCPLGFFGWPTLGLAGAVGISFLAEMGRYRGEAGGGVTARLAGTLFVCGYLGIPFAYLVALRLHGGNLWGMAGLLSLLVIVKMSDAGAYGAGRCWGHHKLAPRLSPNKTIEGAVGGLAVAVATAILFRVCCVPFMVGGAEAPAGGWLAWGAYGALLAVAAMGGDLAESLLKRDLGVKDSSRWLPGLGGGLDLIDSVLWAAPVAYLAWVSGMVGPP